MATPKSVIKIDKDGVKYTSNVDACKYYMYELTRGALRDVAKFVKKKVNDAFYHEFKKRSGKGKKATGYSVWSSKNTQYPKVQIGLNVKGLKYGWFYFQEFGSSHTPRKGLLQKTVEDNIAEIIKIESQYLSGLSGEASRLEALINEKELEGGNDED